jgi:hypothetical protein
MWIFQLPGVDQWDTWEYSNGKGAGAKPLPGYGSGWDTCGATGEIQKEALKTK